MKKFALTLLAATTLMTLVPAHAATNQGEERQDARDVRQECRDGLVGNADCRQDARDVKR
ncbi:hypothetical protein FH968_03915 [Buttiauxella sp. B2]|uniref:hypothetical protein n=1 Tax=Buttiauxella sp. B2 TaxID=2587812 RepID=UPI00111C9A83|nr:hypothetical protein [Buttiauxella sp. B2]TNV22035.1 hypothetical protein FH968_03915 [Buttiauxella sp. B2]